VPLIFHGTATRVQQIPLPNGNAFDGSPQLLRFEVHRMWKGIAARNITIYNLMGSERPKISVGGQYLVFAFLIPLEGRAQLGLPKNGPDAFAASCASRESSNPFADELTDGDTGTIVGR
jgi:hypothetical protein